MGLRGMPEAVIDFEDMEVPADMALMPPRGLKQGFADLMNAYNSQRVGAGTVALGIAAGALDHALDWSEKRQQFGRPINEFQGLQWMLADMSIEAHRGARCVYKPRARRPKAAFPDTLLAAQAKVFTSETAIQVVNDALQFFGARGYSRELPLERMARDVRMFTIGGGTAEVLRTLVASAHARMEAAANTRRLYSQTIHPRCCGVAMHPVFAIAGKTQPIPIWFVHAGNFDSVRREIGERGRAFVVAAGFEAKSGRLMLLPAADGELAGVIVRDRRTRGKRS